VEAHLEPDAVAREALQRITGIQLQRDLRRGFSGHWQLLGGNLNSAREPAALRAAFDIFAPIPASANPASLWPAAITITAFRKHVDWALGWTIL
jgi:hypothetical protein